MGWNPIQQFIDTARDAINNFDDAIEDSVNGLDESLHNFGVSLKESTEQLWDASKDAFEYSWEAANSFPGALQGTIFPVVFKNLPGLLVKLKLDDEFESLLGQDWDILLSAIISGVFTALIIGQIALPGGTLLKVYDIGQTLYNLNNLIGDLRDLDDLEEEQKKAHLDEMARINEELANFLSAIHEELMYFEQDSIYVKSQLGAVVDPDAIRLYAGSKLNNVSPRNVVNSTPQIIQNEVITRVIN